MSALFYVTSSEEEGVTDPRLWAAVSLVVAASTVAHGVSSAPGRHLYRRAAERPAHGPERSTADAGQGGDR